MTVRVRIAGEEREIEVVRLGDGRFRVVVDGRAREYAVEPVADGKIRYAGPDGAHRAIGVAVGNERHLWFDGATIRYEVARGARGASHAREGDLSSPTPGVVAEVLTAPGAEVRRGEKLVVLESMKMFFPIVAPRDGRVGRVLCERGQTVAAGVPLVELADEPETS